MHPALAEFLAHRGDPLAMARAAPRSVQSRIIEASLLLCSRYVGDFRAAGQMYAQLCALDLNAQEALHVRAIGAAAHGDYAGACRIYDEILAQAPRDALALAAAQVFDYYLGDAQSQLARATRASKAWKAGMPGYHAVLALHAYALQECGDYEAAEEAAQRALALQPWDLRAHHAMAHVMEMQGRFEQAIRWMGGRSRLWSGAGAASTHLWWHIALYHLELGAPQRSLAIYDHRMQGGALSELIDASALLWRLHLAGVDVSSRCRSLAARWSPHAGDAHCAFNDLHAMMAFVAAGRQDLASRVLAAQERRVGKPWGANHDMTRLVGLPACRALEAFGNGDYVRAERLLRALPPVAHRIGGSHAQRDVLHLTRSAAAARKAGERLRHAA
jgi:tetratricopeptide (TPR) repeat protein